MLSRANPFSAWLALLLVVCSLGCASPGPPRPPSLGLPQLVANLTAAREGDTVEVQFTLPQRSTDNLPLRPAQVAVTLCRGPEPETCLPVASHTRQTLSVTEASGLPRSISWRDSLPAELVGGDPRPLIYRVELDNLAGRSAGWSAPAFTVAGSAPAPVEGLSAEGTREGILLRWQPSPLPTSGSAAEVLLLRDVVGAPAASAAPRRSGSAAARSAAADHVWLKADARHVAGSELDTLDSSAAQDVPYRYVAVRRRLLDLAGHHLELRSAPSAPVQITLRDIFPPPVPTGLSAVPYSNAGQAAVDLVWNPVEDPGLAGYNITRQLVDQAGSPLAPVSRLNAKPVALPAFHDAAVGPGQRLRYSVTAIDEKGNESAPATVIVETYAAALAPTTP